MKAAKEELPNELYICCFFYIKNILAARWQLPQQKMMAMRKDAHIKQHFK
jgi:hypothetical protein